MSGAISNSAYLENIEARLKKLEAKSGQIETAATVGGLVVGALAGPTLLLVAGGPVSVFSLAQGTGTAKVAACYCGAAAAGGAAGAGIGNITGRVMNRDT